MGATMTATNSKRPLQFHGLFYGLWLGSLVGAVLITIIQPMFYGGAPWLDAGAVMRNTAVYVYPLFAVVGYPLFLVLVRYDKLHFVGFTFAGAVAGVVITVLYLLAHRVLNWFSEANTASMAYVFCSAVVIAWSVWVVSRLTEFIDRKRGYVP